MRRGIARALAVLCLTSLLGACASDGLRATEYDVNPVHAPGVEYVGDTYDAATATTASVATEVTMGLLEPIKILFDALEAATMPGNYPAGASANSPTMGMTPEQRKNWRRTQLGMPQTAEARMAARKSRIRARMSGAVIEPASSVR